MKNRYPQLNNMAQLIKDMHTKFGINYEGEPRILSDEEKQFRFAGMNEEVIEFKDAQDIEEQFDALLDNLVFTLGTAERMGLLSRLEEGFHRVMDCNMNKELGPNNKRGSFSIDLRKPEGWVGPDHSDLVIAEKKVTGLIVLDGPDAAGKSMLAEKFKTHFDAKIIHLTWSPELEEVMDIYMLGCLYQAIELSKTELVVVDRLWLSELIYSEVFREGTKYQTLWSDCQELLRKTKALQILCLPEYEIWMDNYGKMVATRDEMYGNNEKMINIYELYEAFWQGSCIGYGDFISNLVNSLPLRLMEDFVRYDFNEYLTENDEVICLGFIDKLKQIKK